MVIYTLEIIINADFPTPNWVDPVTRGPALYYVNSVFLCLATLSVALRLYTRIWIRNWFGWDDAFVVIALIGICAVTACVFLGYHEFGWDRHIYDIPYDKIQATGQTYYAVKLLWPVASCSVRLSIACLYYRLLKHCELDKFRWILHLNTGFIVAVLFVQMFTSAFACWPVYDIWVWPRPSNPNCLDDDAAILAGAVLNTVSEFIMAALPIPAVFYLGVRGRQRWAVISILSIGFLVSIVGAVRIFFIWKAFTSLDQSWWAAPHFIASEVEIDTALICSCVPILRPMIGRLLTRGPAAARRPALNESGRPMSQKEHKSHSLFARSFHKAKTTELSSDNSDSQKPMTWSDRASHETIDLEGIANDGYGYTVSITTGHASNKPRKLVKEQRVPRDAKSMKERQRAGGESALAVMTELTYDVRESFQEANTNSRAWKKPYSTGMSEADIEKGMQRAGAQLSDWSLLNEVSSIESPGAIAPTQRQEYGDELQDRSRPSTIPVQPMQAHRESISKPSRCILKIGISPSASPTSAIISPFSPSRPRSRPGSRQRSPAAPVNSSQFWASSPHSPLPQGAYHTGQSSPTTQIGFSRQADLSGPIESWSIRDGAVYSPPWEQPLPGSFHSSVNVVDGSRESLVDGEDSQLPVDEERGGLPHSILLPRDRLKRS